MRRWLARAVLAAASVALALPAGELALRATGFSYPSFWVPDDLAGSRLRSGFEGWQRSEGAAYVKINSRGLRDREHSLGKPAGTYRIAVLGDSYAEALQVDAEEAFWSLLPARLERCGFQHGKAIETLNFGVSGYGTAQQLLTLRHRAGAYQPDLVVLAFFPGNDVRNNSRVLEANRHRPFFLLSGGALKLDVSFLGDPAYRAARRLAAQRAWLQDLRLYQLLRRARAGGVRLGDNAPVAAAIAAGDRAPRLAERGLDENALRPPPDRAWEEAWTLTEKLLLAVQQEALSQGAGFLVAVVSTPGSVYPDAAMRARYAAALGPEALFYPERRIERLGERHGFAVVVLGPDMQRHADATGTYLHGFANGRLGFGHWNQTGHALAALLIGRRLCRGGS